MSLAILDSTGNWDHEAWWLICVVNLTCKTGNAHFWVCLVRVFQRWLAGGSHWVRKTCLECGRLHQIDWGPGWKKKQKGEEHAQCSLTHSTVLEWWVCFATVTAVIDGYQTPDPSLFECSLAPVTLQGASRSSISDWGYIIGPPYCEQLLVSLAPQPADYHCELSTYHSISQSNKSLL
jgi:hypothetical protein